MLHVTTTGQHTKRKKQTRQNGSKDVKGGDKSTYSLIYPNIFCEFGQHLTHIVPSCSNETVVFLCDAKLCARQRNVFTLLETSRKPKRTQRTF